MNVEKELNRELLSPHVQTSGDRDVLELYRRVAEAYALAENAIAVLSDMRSGISYVYYGALAETVGLGGRGGSDTVCSIWEKEILDRIHPDDLKDKYLCELRFLYFLKGVPAGRVRDYCMEHRIRMKSAAGGYVPVQHRICYALVGEDGKACLTLCLYKAARSDSREDCCVVNTADGTVTMLDRKNCGELLSDREMQVLRLINGGCTSSEIAARLSISRNTVSRHRQNILSKFDVRNSVEACRIAKDLGLL